MDPARPEPPRPASERPAPERSVPERSGPTRRAAYRAFIPITTRWTDNDVFGHVNNAHYYAFFDTAICTHLVRHGILGHPNPAHITVMAETGCRFHSQTAFPEPLTAGLAISRLGTTSVRYAVAVFREGDDLAAADGFCVHVCVDATTRRPTPIPPTWRDTLTPLLLTPSQGA